MFDLGWGELLLIGTVALIVVGPKDLPGMFRTVGQLVGKAKGMAREFSRAMNDAADDAGVSGINESLRKMSSPLESAMDEVRKTTKNLGKAKSDTAKIKPGDAKPGEPGLAPDVSSEAAPEKTAAPADAATEAAVTKPDKTAAAEKAPAATPAVEPDVTSSEGNV